MPNIPFPDVPEYPGVPPLLRAGNSVIAAIPALAIGIGTLEGILGNSLQQPVTWGIFDSDGDQLGGVNTSGNTILGSLEAQLTGASTPVLSTLSFDFTREAKVSDFPIEQGQFASYNKVQNPASPVVTLALSGSEGDRTNFLNAIDAACISTELYSVVTPEVKYINYSIERYTYTRRADRGVTLLVVEISLKEVRLVSATFTELQVMPITNPQNASATTITNNGMTQAGANDSTALKGARFIGALTF